MPHSCSHALNAAYSRETGSGENERDRLCEFLTRRVGLDTEGRLHGTLFGQFTGPIRTLMETRGE